MVGSLALRGELARSRYHFASGATSTALVTVDAHVTLQRCPVDCVVVLDVSGSMGGSKLKLCVDTLEFLSKELGAQDRFGLVTFDSEVKELIAPCAMDANGKCAVQRALLGLRPGSSTNLSGGLMKGIQSLSSVMPEAGVASTAAGAAAGAASASAAGAAASEAGVKGGVKSAVAKVASVGSSLRNGLMSLSLARPSNKENRAQAGQAGASDEPREVAAKVLVHEAIAVAAGSEQVPDAVPATPAPTKTNKSNSSRSRAVLLLTDGEANVGVCDPATIIQMASSAIKSQTPGAHLITFGYGAGHNTALLETLAVGSGGSYRFVENEDQVAGAFADCLGGLTSVAAQAVRVVVRGAGGARLCASPLTKFPCLALPDAAWQVDIPDLFQGEQRNLLLPLALPALTAPVEDGEAAPAVSVKLAYMDATSGAYTQAELVICVARPEDRALCDAEKDSPDVRLQLLRHEAAQAMEAAQRHAESGHVDAGRTQVKRVADDLRAARAAFAGDEARTAIADAILAELDESAGAFATTTHYRTLGSKVIRQKAYELSHERCTSTLTSKNEQREGQQSTKGSIFRTSGQEVLRKRAMDFVAAKNSGGALSAPPAPPAPLAAPTFTRFMATNVAVPSLTPTDELSDNNNGFATMRMVSDSPPHVAAPIVVTPEGVIVDATNASAPASGPATQAS
jgi:secreted protein with Ig-like and vWFA domain